MFRGKESSNRIELSRLVQDLLNFGVFGSLRLWGWGVRWMGMGGGWMGMGGGWGVPPTHMHMHAHTRMCGKHDNFTQMAASIGFLGNPWEFPMMSYVHIHACACVWGAPPHHPQPTSTHPPPPGETPESVKIQ